MSGPETSLFSSILSHRSAVCHGHARLRLRSSGHPNGAFHGARPLRCFVRMRAAPIHEVIAFLDQLLEPERYDDYGPNGVQVPGGSEVSTVVTGVSAHVALIEAAAAEGADLVLVHHGLFWR